MKRTRIGMLPVSILQSLCPLAGLAFFQLELSFMRSTTSRIWHQVKPIELIQHVLNRLNSSHEDYELLLPDNGEPEGFTWMRRAFPIASWGRVLWSEVSNGLCCMYDSDEGCSLLLQAIIREKELGNPKVLVVWSNQLYPSLEMELDSVERHGELLLSADFDAWIICQEYGWIIEKYHEGEICYGETK